MDGVEVVASDLKYRAGAIEAYVPTTSLVGIAGKRGVLAVVPAAPMVTNVGIATSQGIVQHRVDQLPAGIDGSGITVGAISDSYDTNVAPNSAALDIASGDLPGAGNPAGNTDPVVVLQDQPPNTGTDEGRAMLQIVHDMAPKARLGFATASGGQINLANNIRALAALPGAIHTVPGFKADVIVDDVVYQDEPMFQDGIVAQAVDEVAAAGVSYFSSAGNRPATQAYDSKPRIVPGNSTSWVGTNLDFSLVDPALYAGGFHDFDWGQRRRHRADDSIRCQQHPGLPVERALRSAAAASRWVLPSPRVWAPCRRAALAISRSMARQEHSSTSSSMRTTRPRVFPILI